MPNWREIPFVRLLLPFLIGIGTALNYGPLSYSPLPFLGMLLLFLILFTFIKIPFRFRWLYGIGLNLFLALLGFQITLAHNELRSTSHFQKYLETENIFLVQINDFPRPGQTIRSKAKVLALNGSNPQQQNCQGQLLLYLENNPDYADLRYGDQLLIKAKAKLIPAAKNPEAFDFSAYQKHQNTFYQVFAKHPQWTIIARDQGNPFIATAFKIRQHFQQTLEKHLNTSEEFGVANALILGNRNALTPSVKKAYTSTGATHILAVSGLHVGFIYMGLAFLLGFFRGRGKAWRLFHTLLLLFGVWAFAFITGASPSVLRAAMMFSFIIIGRALHRHTNIYNTLAVSAFFLLCFNPYLLAEVGFQLSYLAVLGIVSFQPWIYRLWIIDNFSGDYLWKLISVSLAAQLTTFPITLFYFHQFPVYFWLSGLVVVPMAMFVLSGGLLLFLLESTLPFLAVFVGYFLYGIIWLMNALIYFIEQLPLALIQGLWISVGGMILLYLLLGILTYFFGERKKYRFQMALLTLALVLGAVAWQSFQRLQQREIIVYHLPGKSRIDLVEGRSVLTIQSPIIEVEKAAYATQNYHWKLGVQKQDVITLDEKKRTGKYWWYSQGYFQFHQQRWAIIDQLPNTPMEQKLKLDCIILRDDADVQASDLLTYFDCSTLIADASNAPWTIARWQQECQQLPLTFIDIREQGAQIIPLN